MEQNKIIQIESVGNRKTVYDDMINRNKMAYDVKKSSNKIRLAHKTTKEELQVHRIRTCSLCGQSFDESDLLWSVRKARHEQYHTKSATTTNKIIDIVFWK